MLSTVFSTRDSILKVFIFMIIYVILGVVVPLQQDTITITYILGLGLTGLLYGLLLSFVFGKMIGGRWERILVVWFAIFVIQFFNPLIEGFLFTTRISVEMLFGGLSFTLLISFVYAFVAGVLFIPRNATGSFRTEMSTYFNQRRTSNWILRLVGVSLLWVPIYFIFGGLVGPLVLPYYTDPNSPYYLVLPSVDILLLLQAARGFIYLGCLLPLLILLKIDLNQLLMVLTGFLFIGGGLAIFIIVESFPVFLRVVHSIDLFGDSFGFSVALTYLLGNRPVSQE